MRPLLAARLADHDGRASRILRLADPTQVASSQRDPAPASALEAAD